MSESDHEPPAKKRRIACKSCRQSKLRCDLSIPPCSRCKRMGLNCVLDPGFKRVSKQNQVDELQSHVQQLQSLVQKQQHEHAHSPDSRLSPGTASPSHGGPSISGSAKASRLRSDMDGSHPSTLSDQPRTTTNSNDRGETVYTLGGVQLGKTLSDSLVRIYFEHYHHFLPILDPSKTGEHLYKSSPFLFWAILSVAFRQEQQHRPLLLKLAPELESFIWASVAAQQIPVPGIQALLLLSCWPLPHTRILMDNALLLAHIAVTSAMRLGLHKPGREAEFLRGGDDTPIRNTGLGERVRTWVACAILAQNHAVDYGLSPAVSLKDWTLKRAVSDDPMFPIPLELCHNLMIQRCSHTAFQRLTQNEDSPFGLPSEPEIYTDLSTIEHDFEALAESIGSGISFINEIRIRVARLYLQDMYFFIDTLDERRKRCILKTYTLAQSIISNLISDDRAPDLLRFAPWSVYRTILCAATVVLRVAHSSYASEIDYESGKVLFNAGLFAVRQLSVGWACGRDSNGAARDLVLRAAETLSLIWRYAKDDEDLKSRPPTLTVKSRMGCSILYDCVFLKRKYVAGNKAEQPPNTAALPTHPTSAPNNAQDSAMAASATINGIPLQIPPIQAGYLPGNSTYIPTGMNTAPPSGWTPSTTMMDTTAGVNGAAMNFQDPNAFWNGLNLSNDTATFDSISMWTGVPEIDWMGDFGYNMPFDMF